MYADDFVARLEKGLFPPIVLFSGDSEDVLNEMLRRLRDAFLKKNPGATVQSYDGARHELPDLLSAAQMSSLFASNQMLVMRRAEKRIGGKQADGAIELLTDYLQNSNPLTLIALVSQTKSQGKETRVSTLASKKGWLVQCGELPAWKTAAWVATLANESGLKLSSSCIQAFIEKIGTDMGRIRTAMEHLSVFIHPSREPRPEEIRSLPIPGAEPEIFAFLDAVSSRRSKEALKWLAEVERNSFTEESGMLFMLHGRIKELLLVSSCREQGLSEPEAAKAIPMHPYKLKNLWEQAKKTKTADLEKALIDIIRIQAGQVTGRSTKNTLVRSLERWILKWGKQKTHSVLA